MSRSKPQHLPPGERNKLLSEFWTTIALLESVEEIKNFFKDLLSETEAIMLARRLKIARMISEGEDYDSIQKTMKTSSATVASVHAWLDGGFGGYSEGLKKLHREIDRRIALERKKHQERDPASFAHLKKKYPLHLLLCNVADEAKYRPPRKLRR